MFRWISVLALLLIPMLLGACQQNRQTYTNVVDPTLKPGDRVPPPSGPTILTIKGMIGTKNLDDRLDFDMQTLERLGLVEYEVDDPFLKRVVTYRGPLLRTVLEVAGVSPDAKELFAIALNEYKTTIPLEVTKWPVIIATSRDGKRMPVENDGPLEIVFPNKDFNTEPTMYNQMWVWQLRELVVR